MMPYVGSRRAPGESILLDINPEANMSAIASVTSCHFARVMVAGIMALGLSCNFDYKQTLPSLFKHGIPEWWDEGKIGIFVHWGPASVPAFGSRKPVTVPGGWYSWGLHFGPFTELYKHHRETYGEDFVYDDFIEQFRAEKFNANEWIDLFAEAGAKYFILTAKHHDGFALWPSKVSHRDAGDMGPRRDLVGELVTAANKKGNIVKPGLYYSMPEFFTTAPSPMQTSLPWPYWVPTAALSGLLIKNEDNPVLKLMGAICKLLTKPLPGDDCQPFYKGPQVNPFTGQLTAYVGSVPMNDYAENQVRPQLRELIDTYKPYIIYGDMGGPENYFRSNEIIAEYFKKAEVCHPEGVIVNDRLGDEHTHADYATIEINSDFVRDGKDPGKRAEVSLPLGFSYFYDQRDGEAEHRSVDQLVDIIVTEVSRNRNVLLGVGPKANGEITSIQKSRLRGIGKWLKINGESIYATKKWDAAPDTDTLIRYTVAKSGNIMYATALKWPGSSVTLSSSLPYTRHTKVALVGSSLANIPYRIRNGSIVLQLPANPPAGTEHAFVFRITGIGGI